MSISTALSRIDADTHAGGNRHLPVVDPQRRRQRFGDKGGDQRGARRVAIRQRDDELVAAQASQQVGRLNTGAQPFGELDQQSVARRVPKGVVDVLEVIEVEEHQRELLSRRTVVDGLVDQLAQLRTIWQPGQHVVVGEPGDLRPRLLSFDRQRTEVNAGVDDPLMPAARRPGLPEIEGEGSDRRGRPWP